MRKREGGLQRTWAMSPFQTQSDLPIDAPSIAQCNRGIGYADGMWRMSISQTFSSTGCMRHGTKKREGERVGDLLGQWAPHELDPSL